MSIFSFLSGRFGGGGGGGGGGATPGWVRHVCTIYTSCIILYMCFKRVYAATEEVNGGEAKEIGRYKVATFNFEHVSDVYAITLWILLGSLAKVGFHLSHKLTKKFPESCLLIILGLVVGGLLYATKLAEQKAYVLNSDTFFLFLLPPIILEAGYFMPNRPFFDNIGTILLFAIANTFFNTILIGLTLWGFNFTPLYGGTQFEMLHCFVFAALISAVDPVAVLATFVEIHVNDMLYIVVFGESLLNDAVSVVLYRLFDAFAGMGQENILPVDLVLGATSFVIVAFGGVLIGIIFGIIACFTTKFTEHTPILEPLIILTYSYLSYLTAEMFSTSGILAITFCGMFMKQYVEFNISKKSNATIEYVLKMLSSIMETIIFMFMGLSTISDHHSWNTGFVIITILCCSIYRIFGVILFANIANHWRLLELTRTDMLIMSYGGIRGAVAFALALILDESKIPRKKEFVTATIAVVFFTVFLQGTTIGPIVEYFKVKTKEEEEPTMSAKLTNRLIDHVMSCLEDIAGVAGKHSLRDKVRKYDRRILKPLLLRKKLTSKDDKLLSTFQKINEYNVNKMAENPAYQFPSSASMARLSSNINRNQSIGNLLASGSRPTFEQQQPNWLSEVSTVPDFQILGTAHSQRAEEDAQFHHLLENAMYDPRRQQTIHKRSQLDEENMYRRPRSVGVDMFHHQKPVNLRTLIDPKYMEVKKRSSSSGVAGRAKDKQKSKPLISGSKSVDTGRFRRERTPEDIRMVPTIKIVGDNNNSQQQQQKEQKDDVPPSPAPNLPPPWKSSSIVDTSEEEPMKAHMPSWANNPDYTLHATATKQDDGKRSTVFGLFGESTADREEEQPAASFKQQQQQQQQQQQSSLKQRKTSETQSNSSTNSGSSKKQSKGSKKGSGGGGSEPSTRL